MPRKGENIYKRKDGRWEGRYIKGRTPEGKALYGYLYAHNYYDLKQKLRKCLQEQKEQTEINKVSVPDSIEFKKISEAWLNSTKPQIKDSTYAKYANLLNTYIFPYFGDQLIEDINYENIEYFSTQMLTQGGRTSNGLSAKTVNDCLVLIRTILAYAANHGCKPQCSGKGISIRQTAKELSVLSINDQKTLFNYLHSNLDDRNLGILLSMLTGLRIGEICALKWEDISIPEKTVYVHSTMQRIQIVEPMEAKTKTKISITTPKSSCSIRKIPLSDEIITIMEQFEKQSGFVLTGNDSSYIEPRSMHNHFKRVCKNAGIDPVNFHVLRHTFATRCVELGFDVKSLSEILGHANVSITLNRYVHPSMALKRANMEKLSELFAVK